MSDPPARPVLDFAAFRAAVSDSFVPLRVSSDDPEHFRGRIDSVAASALHLSDITANGHVVERTPELLARDGGDPYYKISMLLAGTGLLIQDGREAVLRPGWLTVHETDRPYTLVFDAPFRNLVIMFPKGRLGLPPALVSQLTAVPMSGRAGVGAIIAPFLAQLGRHQTELTGATGARLAHAALDLVSTLLSSELDVAATASGRHYALLQRIRDYIEANLDSPELGPTTIATAHYVSTRQLHSMFRSQGTTVSTWIREQRLERCRRDLLDPRLRDQPVAVIAARHGFLDAAHFSRVFKARFGAPPTEVRMMQAA